MSKAKSAQGSYEVPFHKCQACYQHTGRFILDCYCVICQHCYRPATADTCLFCNKPTNNRKLDTKDAATFEKVGCMFDSPQNMLDKGIEILRFQRTITNRYVQHIEAQLKLYKSSVYDLINTNPRLNKYFSERIKGFKLPLKSVKDHHRSKSDMSEAPNKPKQSLHAEEPHRDKRQKESKYLLNKQSEDRGNIQITPAKLQQHNYREELPKPQKQYAPKVQHKYAVESDDTEHSFYNRQNRVVKDDYNVWQQNQSKGDGRWDNQKYQRVNKPKDKSCTRSGKSNTEILNSSYIGKRSSGARDFLAHGFRRRP